MASFINLNLDGKINTNFFIKHLVFSFFWITGILLFIFRLDIVIIEKYSNSLQWLKLSLPTIYFICLVVYLLFLKWYYILAFFAYPILVIFWFLPKTILSAGKIYLLGRYLNGIYM